MAYKVNDTTVIDDTGNIQSVAGLTLNNDSGVISVADTSPMVGTVAGYVSGGQSGSPAVPVNTVDKFPFASDSNVSDIGDLNITRYSHGSASSSISGYSMCGFTQPGSSNIEKFFFAGSFRSSTVGNSTAARGQIAGHSSLTNGYTSAGNPGATNTIDKFPFAVDSNATDVGDLTVARRILAGHSSITHGFVSGGYSGGLTPTVTLFDTIDRFSFSTDTNASDVGDLSSTKWAHAGQSSTTHGYVSGGSSVYPLSATNVIDKFLFSSSANATDIGDLTQGRYGPAGLSSTVSGYSCGGTIPTPANVNTIDKFPFATDSNATDVGDTSQSRTRSAGQQD